MTHISLLPIVYTTIAGQTIPPNKLEVGVFGAIAPPIEQLLGGVRVVPAFGMTETVIHATTAAPYQPIPPGSMGTPTPGYEMLVVDPATDEVLTDGRIGELLVRGTRGIQMFLEYYGNPGATSESFTADGFFKTGDRVRIGEGGALFYSERDKDMLKVGGENVSAKEIEDLCRQVPGVGDVAVVGRSHPTLDEVPVVFVVKGPGAAADPRSSAKSSRLPRRTWLTSRFLAPSITSTISRGPRSTRSQRTCCVNRPTTFPRPSDGEPEPQGRIALPVQGILLISGPNPTRTQLLIECVIHVNSGVAMKVLAKGFIDLRRTALPLATATVILAGHVCFGVVCGGGGGRIVQSHAGVERPHQRYLARRGQDL